MKKIYLKAYILVFVALGVMSGALIYNDNKSLWIMVAFFIGLVVVPISLFRLFPRLKESTKGRGLLGVLLTGSILSPILGVESVFLLQLAYM